ncbi:hypothetical protein, partial [Liquorilactobacillus vini]|uniref:hypothetical protein n=1 Tax=Liquorilactobacillus vini TaxID=238015 RepID=UPI000550EB11
DIVKDGINGYLSECDYADFYKKIRFFVKHIDHFRENRSIIRNSIDNFYEDIYFKRFTKLF